MKLPDEDHDRRLQVDSAETTEIGANGQLVKLRVERKVPWIPTHLCQFALKMSHNHHTSAHTGFFKPLKHVSSRFAWLVMSVDVTIHVCCCQVCQRSKTHRLKHVGHMRSQWATAQMEDLNVDIVGPLPFIPRRKKHILVIVYKFTVYIEPLLL